MILKKKMMIQRKRLFTILLIVTLILLIPLIAMQFTDEVNWTFADFVVAGFLLFGTGILFDMIMRKVNNSDYRVVLYVVLLVVFLLIWAELAVGVFGTPFGGN